MVSAEPKVKNVGGRQSEYTEDRATDICTWIAQGKSLRAYCQQENTPDIATVYRWLAAHESFRDQYARAREDQADSLADEITFIADTEDDANKARVRIDARTWVASKLKPKKYGDKLGISGDGDGAPIEHRHDIAFVIVDPAKA
jgi:hypothetical protein